MEHSQRLKDYGIDKLSKLEKYVDSVLDAEITFTVEKFRHRTQVVLTADGLKIAAEQESDDMYSSVDLVVDKLEKQIKRQRQKQRSRSGKGKANLNDFMEEARAKEDSLPRQDSPSPQRPGNGKGNGQAYERYANNALDLPLVSMTLGDALDKISQSSLPFLVFIDQSDGGVRLLRHTGGGSIEFVRFHRQAD
jgi:putative sigma-54 modulation protein